VLSEADKEILKRARRLARTLTAEDLTLIQARVDVHYKKRGSGKTPKHKGGKHPVDFDAVETLQDLRKVLSRSYPDPDAVLPLYMRLKALVGD